MYRYIYISDYPRHNFAFGGGPVKRSVAAVSAALLTSGVLTCVTTTAHAAAPSAPSPEPAAAARADSLVRANPGAVQGASGEAYQAVRTKVDPSGRRTPLQPDLPGPAGLRR